MVVKNIRPIDFQNASAPGPSGDDLSSDTAVLEKIDRPKTYRQVANPRDYLRSRPIDVTPTDPVDAEDTIATWVSAEQRAEWRGRGKIGLFENFRRHGDQVVPFKGLVDVARLMSAVNRLSNPPSPTPTPKESVGIGLDIRRGPVGQFQEFQEQQFSWLPAEEQQRRIDAQLDEDRAIVIKYLEQVQEEMDRGVSIGGKIAAGVVELPEFMLTFALTGGAATLGKKGAMTALTSLARRQMKKSFVGKTVVGLGAAVGRTIAAPHQVGEAAIRRQIDSRLVLTDRGLTFLRESQENPAKSLLLAFGDTLVEMFSEASGASISVGLKKMVPGLKGFKRTFELLFAKSKTAKKGLDLWSRAGWNGFLEEMGEEQLGSVLRAMLNITDPGSTPESFLDRVAGSAIWGEELLVTAGVISFAGMGRAGSLALLENRRAKFGDDRTEADELPQWLIDKVISGEDATADVERYLKEKKQKPVPRTSSAAKVDEVKLLAAKKRLDSIRDEQDQKLTDVDVLSEKIKAARPGTGVRNNLLKKRAKIENEIADLGTEAGKIKVELSRGGSDTLTVEARAKLRQTRFGTFMNEVRAAMNREKKLTDKERKDIQRELEGFVKSRVTNKEDQALFFTKIRNIANNEDLEKALPDIVKKINEVEERFAAKRETFRIKQIIKRSKAKKVAGKLKGKFTPKIQGLFDTFRKATKTSQVDAGLKEFFTNNKGKLSVEEQAAIAGVAADAQSNILLSETQEISKWSDAKKAEKIAENSEKIQAQISGKQEVDVDLVAQNLALTAMSGLKGKTSRQLRDIRKDLEALASAGKSQHKRHVAKRKLRNAELIARFLKSVEGDRPIKEGSGRTDKQLEKDANSVLKNLNKSLSGWGDLMDMLARDESATLEFDSDTFKLTDVTAIEAKERADVHRAGQRWLRDYMEAQGHRFETAALHHLRKDMRQLPKDLRLKLMVDASGKEVDLSSLTKSQIRNIYMLTLDPSLMEALTSKDGGMILGHHRIRGLTPEMMKEMFKGSILTAQDKAFARAQLQIYQELYDVVNKQYRLDFGVDLPFNEFYSPIKRRLKDNTDPETFLDEYTYRATINPSGLKQRVKNFNPISVQSDVDVFQKYIYEMYHYTNWSEKIKDLKAIFGNLEVQTAIEAKFGKRMPQIINGYIQRYIEAGKRNSDLASSMLDKVRINYTVAALALKPAITVKQMVSFMAMWEHVPLHQVAIGYTELITQPHKWKQRWDIIKKSDYMLTRGNNISRDLADVSMEQQFALLRSNFSVKNWLTVTTRIGDQGAIVMGAWPVYRYHLKRTGSHEEALKQFTSAANRTQQSSYLSQLSEFQHGGSFQKMFTMFTSSQNQYYRREVAALRNLLAGRTTIRQFAKSVFIYHFFLPMMFQYVADGFEFDEASQLRAGIIGSFNGIFALNDALDGIVRTLVNNFTDYDIRTYESSSLVSDVINEIISQVSKMSADDVTVMEMAEAAFRIVGTAALTKAPIPTDRLLDLVTAAHKFREGDGAEGMMIVTGWSPSVAEKRLTED